MAEQLKSKAEDARIARSRAAMRQAMLDLLEETPLEQIDGARIAARARIGYATYFRHYRNVRDLLVDTVVHLADDLTARMLPAMIAADTGGASRALVEAIQARRPAFLALMRGAGDETRGMLARHIAERATTLPDLSPDWLPQRLATRFTVVSIIELLDWWLCEEPQRNPEEIAELLDRLVLAPLRRG